MDMGCHGIAFCYWFFDRSPIKSVTCHMGTYVHGDKTRGEDDSICILEFANGGVGLVENSWAKRGGMDDRTEIYGEGGVSYAEPAHGQRHADLQRVRLRLRGREGAQHQGLDAIRYSTNCGTTAAARDAALRALRARQGNAAVVPAKTAAW